MINTYNMFDFTNITDSLQALMNLKELTFQIFNMFPIPVVVFNPDGTASYTNRAFLDLNGITDVDLFIGKYNPKHDPVCNAQKGCREAIQRAFRGEVISASGFSVPVQHLVDRGIIEEKPFEKALGDIYLYPAWKGGQLVCVICVYVVTSIYQGMPDVIRAKEYIDNHWREPFDQRELAKYVNMSVRQLYNLFIKHTGMTAMDYYKDRKVEHIKEKLMDNCLTIKEAFAACGEDSRGNYAKIFKALTGLSPKEFRASLK